MSLRRISNWLACAAVFLTLVMATPAVAEQVVIQRHVTIREAASRQSRVVIYPDVGARFELLDEGRQSRGYYHIRLPDGRAGWVYRTFVRREPDAGPGDAAPDAPVGNQMVAHFIDVDQGAAALLEFPCGAVLIDAGGFGPPFVPPNRPSDAGPIGDHLIDYLNRFFARRTDLNRTLSAVFISHAHVDHNRYLQRVVEGFTVRGYVHNGSIRGHSASWHANWMDRRVRAAATAIPWDAITEADLRAAGTAGVTNSIIDPVNCQGTDPLIRVLQGGRTTNPGWNSDDWGDDNNHSLVIRIDYDQASFLFSGDMETRALEALVAQYDATDLLDVSVWAVGHHGSYNGITRGLVEEVTPEVAVLSVGPHTRRGGYTAYEHGHPREVVFDELERVMPTNMAPRNVMVARGQRNFVSRAIRSAIYATGWNGDVTVSAQADGTIRVRTSR